MTLFIVFLLSLFCEANKLLRTEGRLHATAKTRSGRFQREAGETSLPGENPAKLA
jgi:hypothetical protein